MAEAWGQGLGRLYGPLYMERTDELVCDADLTGRSYPVPVAVILTQRLDVWAMQ